MAKKLSRLDLSSITGENNDIYEIDAVYLGGVEASSYATQDWVKGLLAGKVDYLGTVEAMNKLPTGEGIGAGDFCRVKTEFDFGTEKAHEGDLLIALSDNPPQSILGWDLIHNEYDWTHKHTFTPAGTISQPTFAGTASVTEKAKETSSASAPGHTHNVSVSGDVTITTEGLVTGSPANYTPAGTISAPTFTGTSVTTNNITGTVSVVENIQSATAGSPVFTGTSVTTGVNNESPIKAVTSVSAKLANAPTFTGSAVFCESCADTGVVSVVGTLKMPTFDVSKKILTIKKGSFSSVEVAASSHTHGVTAKGTVSQPDIIVSTVPGDVAPNGHTHNVTAAGAVSAPTITITPTITTVATSDHTHKVTAAGTVGAPTFTGTGTIIKGTFEKSVTTDSSSQTVSVSGPDHTHNVTAAGTVSALTFTGTEGTTSVPKA